MLLASRVAVMCVCVWLSQVACLQIDPLAAAALLGLHCALEAWNRDNLVLRQREDGDPQIVELEDQSLALADVGAAPPTPSMAEFSGRCAAPACKATAVDDCLVQ